MKSKVVNIPLQCFNLNCSASVAKCDCWDICTNFKRRITNDLRKRATAKENNLND